MYSISYSVVCLWYVNIMDLLTHGKSPRNDLHAASNKLAITTAAGQRRPKAFSLSADNSSSRSILQSAKRKSLPASCGTTSLTTGKRNTFENGSAFKANLRIVRSWRFLCRSSHLLCRVPGKVIVSWKRQLKPTCLHRNRSNIYSSSPITLRLVRSDTLSDRQWIRQNWRSVHRELRLLLALDAVLLSTLIERWDWELLHWQQCQTDVYLLARIFPEMSKKDIWIVPFFKYPLLDIAFYLCKRDITLPLKKVFSKG